MKHLFTLLVMMMLFLADGYCQISIIGPASPSGNWTADHDLTESSPGVWTGTFTLNAGELKFRQNHDWANNWGSASFPSGTGVLNGASIPVSPAGVYSITFNASTLLYSFQIRGRVGVNNTDPQAGLDIDGGLRTRTQVEGVNNTTNSAFIPLERSFVWIEGATAPYAISIDAGYADGSRLVLFNGTSHDATFGIVTIPSNKAMEFIKLDGDFRALGASAGGSDGWSTLGNSGSNPLTDFIGTTDNQPLVFKTNNTKRMQIETSNDVNELKFETDLEKKNRISFENSGDISGDPFGVKINMETVSDPIFFHGINFSSQSNDYPDFNKQNILHIGADGNVGVGGKDPYGKMTIGHRAIGPYPTLTLIDSSQTNEGGSILKFRKFDAFSDFSIRSHLGADYEADQSSLRFAWSGYNLLNLRGDGRLGLYNIGNNSGLELGYNHSSKSTDAGKIQYGGFGGNDHVLNIVGGGTDPSGNDRKVKIWAEGGTEVNGSLGVGGKIKLGDDNNTPIAGAVRWNANTQDFEGFNGTKWLSLTKANSSTFGIISPSQTSENNKLTSSNSNTGDSFGHSVAIFEDYAVIGAPFADIGTNSNQGCVYIFIRTENSWTEQGILIASDGATNDYFGCSVAINGDYIIIGAYGDMVDTDINEGSAYIFIRSGATWTQQSKLTESSPWYNNKFGYSVSIYGIYAIVGAYGYGVNQGIAYIYLRSGSSWALQNSLTVSGGQINDEFGKSVAIFEDYAIIGAPKDDVGTNGDRGSAYIFVRSGTNWTQQAMLSGPFGNAGDEFGSSVSINGEYAIVGAPFIDFTGGQTSSNEGAAHIFKRAGSTWSHHSILSALDKQISDEFGISVDIYGDYVVVGALTDSNKGSAYVYRNNGDSWSQVVKLISSDGKTSDFFGYSVSIHGDYAIIGAAEDDHGSGYTNEGSAYIFQKN